MLGKYAHSSVLVQCLVYAQQELSLEPERSQTELNVDIASGLAAESPCEPVWPRGSTARDWKPDRHRFESERRPSFLFNKWTLSCGFVPLILHKTVQ